jgi:hypothetical protein
MSDEMALNSTTASAAQTHASGLPQTVTIPVEQLQAFTGVQARLAQLEAEQRNREAAAQQEQAKILAQKGEVENALRMLREQSEQQVQVERAKLSATEDRAKRYALEGELSRVLGSQNLVSGGADQLSRLWRQEFHVQAEGESFVVRTPTFQSVNEFVQSQLARPEYAHFVRSTNQGGTAGTTGGHHVPPTTPPNPSLPPQPKTMGEAVILHMQSIRDKDGVDPRMNLSAAMGLKGHARH